MSSVSFIHTIDDALKASIFTKFASFFGLTNQNKDIVFQPKSICQRKIAEKRGEASVEFISLWRTNTGTDWGRQRSALARSGMNIEFVDSNKTSVVNIKAVPVILSYELRFWSRNLDSITLAIESYLNWFQSTPNLKLYYQGLYEMDMYLKFGEAVDETDFDIYNKGLYYITRVPLTIEGWLLTEVTSKTVLKIILDIFLREGTAPNYLDTLVSETTITASSVITE